MGSPAARLTNPPLPRADAGILPSPAFTPESPRRPGGVRRFADHLFFRHRTKAVSHRPRGGQGSTPCPAAFSPETPFFRRRRRRNLFERSRATSPTPPAKDEERGAKHRLREREHAGAGSCAGSRHGRKRVFRPRVFGVASAHLGTHKGIAVPPEMLKVTRDLPGPSRRRKQVHEDGHSPSGHGGRFHHPEKLLQFDGQNRNGAFRGSLVTQADMGAGRHFQSSRNLPFARGRLSHGTSERKAAPRSIREKWDRREIPSRKGASQLSRSASRTASERSGHASGSRDASRRTRKRHCSSSFRPRQAGQPEAADAVQHSRSASCTARSPPPSRRGRSSRTRAP